MNKTSLYIATFVISIATYSCAQIIDSEDASDLILKDSAIIPINDSTVLLRFQVPQGCKRTTIDSTSFAFHLRNLPLKDKDEIVKYYNGDTKPNRNVYVAVVDMSLGNRDLQQCADAVMRLRAEFLYHTEQYDKIYFNFLSDGEPRNYNDYHKGDLSYEKFLKYMDYVFAYANTSSLLDELVSVEDPKNMQIGDVFIQKGRPYGHAIIVVDMCYNEETDETYFILAQSYMPAQDTQILVNPNDSDLSPWYKLGEGVLQTPEWAFEFSDLRRFP